VSAPTRDPCATCGACCRSYVVPVCGHDVWSISARQRLGPEQFLITYPQREEGPDGFRLQQDGPTYGLALDKQGPLRAEGPCIFLLRLGGGHDRCGIYAERPVVCRSYPMSLWRDAVVQRDDALCPPASWSAGDVALPAWRDALQRQRMRFDVYHEVVARWNARVAEPGGSAPRTLPAYFSYLLNVYDRLDRLERELGAPAMAQIEVAWRSLPDPAHRASGARPDGDVGWVRYLERACEIVDGFYAGVTPPPSPLRARAATVARHEAEQAMHRDGAR
jgi:Fe-S-cluster containining protein